MSRTVVPEGAQLPGLCSKVNRGLHVARSHT